jgi:hypothetical protein
MPPEDSCPGALYDPDNCTIEGDSCTTNINDPDVCITGGTEDVCDRQRGLEDECPGGNTNGPDTCNVADSVKCTIEDDCRLPGSDICKPEKPDSSYDSCYTTTNGASEADLCDPSRGESDLCGGEQEDLCPSPEVPGEDICPTGMPSDDNCEGGLPNVDICPSGTTAADVCIPPRLDTDECVTTITDSDTILQPPPIS